MGILNYCKIFIFALMMLSFPIEGIANSLSDATVSDINFYKYPREAPDAKLKDKNDKEVTLSDYKGKVVLLNIWSRRCGPCVKELPMLDALQKEMDKDKFLVMAATKDWQSGATVKEYLDLRSLKSLEPLVDYSGMLNSEVGVMTYPVTIIIDKNGMEIGRLRGAADWNNPQIRGMLINLYKDNSQADSAKSQYGWKAQPQKNEAKPWMRSK